MFPEAAPYPSVVLFKDFDEKKVIYRTVLGKSVLKTFLKDAEVSRIAMLNPLLLDLFVWSTAKKQGVVLFRKEEDKEAMDKEYSALRDANPSKEYVFMTSSYSEMEEHEIKTYFGINKEDMPALVIVQNENTELKLFVYRGEIAKEEMIEFFNNWKHGKAPRYYKSAALPETNPGPMFTVVASNFKAEAIESKMDVFVFFKVPNCEDCIKFSYAYGDVADAFPTIKFLVFDAMENEVEGLHVQELPLVMLYPSKDKTNPIKFRPGTKSEFINFLIAHCQESLQDDIKVDL